MLTIHNDVQAMKNISNGICIYPSDNGLLIVTPDEEPREVRKENFTMQNLKYPCEILYFILGSKANLEVNISQDALAIVMDACEINRTFF